MLKLNPQNGFNIKLTIINKTFSNRMCSLDVI